LGGLFIGATFKEIAIGAPGPGTGDEDVVVDADGATVAGERFKG